MKRSIVLMFIVFLIGFSSAWAQGRKISGHIEDSVGKSIPTAIVKIIGSVRGAVADVNGNFTIDTKTGDKLEISSVGYITKVVTVQPSIVHIKIVLKQKANMLNETVVTALGISRKKRALGYAVSTVSGADIIRTQSPNFAAALYGRVPGLQVSSAPGGATSGVFFQVRGLESITGNTQPLIVLDGVPIRNDQSFTDYSGNRIAGDGLLDINPEDIASISVLKGASAAALYGSEAANGVILITTKKGKNQGFSVSFNASYSVSKLAYLPKEQNLYGPGYSTQLSPAGQSAARWDSVEYNGQMVRFPMNTRLNFGPKFDGEPTLAWDGKMHPYVAQQNNNSAMFQTPQTSIESIKISDVTKTTNVRFDLTRQDNTMLSPNSKNQKDIADFNTEFNPSKLYSTSLMIDYINQRTDNRPYVNYQMIQNFSGMINRFDNAQWELAKYKTSLGYYRVLGSSPSLTPDENLTLPGYNIYVMSYFWNTMMDKTTEKSNRLIASWDNTITPVKGLHLKTQIATDYTGGNLVTENASTIPILYGPSGSYSQVASTALWTYGQVTIDYRFNFTKDWGLHLTAGYNARKEQYTSEGASTVGGLSQENFFNLVASESTPTSSSNETNFLTDGIFGMVDASYKDILYLEATGRRDRTSTMRPGNNTYFYPSVNGSFILSDAFHLPSFISFAKIRASYGEVGSYPAAYQANRAYSLGRLADGWPYGSILYTTVNTDANDDISPEREKQAAAGLVANFLNDRFGLTINYYNGEIVNQIEPISLPPSSGGSSKLANVGTLSNKGLEVIVNATPIQSKAFRWSLNFNISRNINKVVSLAQGLKTLVVSNNDGNAWEAVAQVGRPVGDILVHPIERLDGKPIIDQSNNLDETGLYIVNPDTMVTAGNIQPAAIGGISNMLTYKGFTLSANANFQIGGTVIPTGYFWMYGSGIMAPTLKYRDAAHGGLSYYVDGNGDRVLITNGTSAPNGDQVYHDGLILNGVTPDGKPNTKIASAEEYYDVTYNWGGPQYSPNTRYDLYVRKNNYIEMRDMSLGYNLPRTLISKWGMKSLNVSIFGRNLFYIYRSIKFMDPEILTGGPNWSQNLSSMGKSWATRTFGVMIRAQF